MSLRIQAKEASTVAGIDGRAPCRGLHSQWIEAEPRAGRAKIGLLLLVEVATRIFVTAAAGVVLATIAATTTIVPATIATLVTLAIVGTTTTTTRLGRSCSGAGTGGARGSRGDSRHHGCFSLNLVLIGKAKLFQQQSIARRGEGRQNGSAGDVVGSAGEAGVKAAQQI